MYHGSHLRQETNGNQHCPHPRCRDVPCGESPPVVLREGGKLADESSTLPSSDLVWGGEEVTEKLSGVVDVHDQLLDV